MSKVVNGFACLGGAGGAANATTHAHSALPASGVAGESRYEIQVIIRSRAESLEMAWGALTVATCVLHTVAGRASSVP